VSQKEQQQQNVRCFHVPLKKEAEEKLTGEFLEWDDVLYKLVQFHKADVTGCHRRHPLICHTSHTVSIHFLYKVPPGLAGLPQSLSNKGRLVMLLDSSNFLQTGYAMNSYLD